jgi:hypothetical protein
MIGNTLTISSNVFEFGCATHCQKKYENADKGKKNTEEGG